MQALLTIALKSSPGNCCIEPVNTCDVKKYATLRIKQTLMKINSTYIPNVITVKTPETSRPSWAYQRRAWLSTKEIMNKNFNLHKSLFSLISNSLYLIIDCQEGMMTSKTKQILPSKPTKTRLRTNNPWVKKNKFSIRLYVYKRSFQHVCHHYEKLKHQFYRII